MIFSIIIPFIWLLDLISRQLPSKQSALIATKV